MKPGASARAAFPLFASEYAEYDGQTAYGVQTAPYARPASRGPVSRPLVFLDNAATTQKPQTVLAAMDTYYRSANANPGRGFYQLQTWSNQLLEDARSAVARFIGAHEAHEVIFTESCTASLNAIADFCGSSILSPGDRIVLPYSEHHSNLLPWQAAAQRSGARIEYLPLEADGRLSATTLEQTMGDRCRVFALAHVSNVLGLENDLTPLIECAHAKGAIVVLDCAQSIGHLPLDLGALGADFAAFSAHKAYGPQGIGVLYGREALLERMQPFLLGGGMVEYVDEDGATFAPLSRRLEGGSRNVCGAVGLAQALGFIDSIGREEIRAHERALALRAIEGLQKIGGVTVYGDAAPDDARCGIVSFNVRGIHAHDIARLLSRQNICVRSGNCCAQPLMRRLGIVAVCRMSLSCANTVEDIDRFVDAVKAAIIEVGNYVSAAVM